MMSLTRIDRYFDSSYYFWTISSFFIIIWRLSDVDAMAVVKAVISFYRTGEEKNFAERYKAKIKMEDCYRPRYYIKEIIKASNEMGGGLKYFTHPFSYYPVPQTGMSLKDAKLMTPLAADMLTKKAEETMKEWLENYRPARQSENREERGHKT